MSTEVGALGPAGDLLAALVQRNVDDLASTNDRIQRIQEAQLTSMAQAYVDLFEQVDQHEVLPRNLVRYLDLSFHHVESARRILTPTVG